MLKVWFPWPTKLSWIKYSSGIIVNLRINNIAPIFLLFLFFNKYILQNYVYELIINKNYIFLLYLKHISNTL